MTFSSSGRASLCFPSDGSWFQGYFVCASSRAQLGLLGEEIPVDDWYVACGLLPRFLAVLLKLSISVACPDGGYQEYRLTVIHFALEKEVELVVRKTGGDLSQLNSDEIQFQPSMLLTDAKAVEAIETYFPSIAERVNHDASLLEGCTVCFGDMEITGLVFPS
ncbi:hypothetical protein P3T76_007175 [Phytophthora citrophthora]|uniref:Uncharacterized protein n=1 Tax=Phytophthora citrophthora TaxID=4793 RepID=A0AAD9GM23_9STRA|nr:hypothetical protein P3T76_007175 [Phytophthora citrophthora]